MKRLLAGLFTIFLTVCGITGCSQPAGSILENGDLGNGSGNFNLYDFIMLRPNRILYEYDAGRDGRFVRYEDLRVFVADENGYRAIDTLDPDLLLEIVIHPGGIGETVRELNSYFPFPEPGRYIIRGTYNGESDEYSIEVRGSLVNPGEGQDNIGMIWL